MTVTGCLLAIVAFVYTWRTQPEAGQPSRAWISYSERYVDGYTDNIQRDHPVRLILGGTTVGVGEGTGLTVRHTDTQQKQRRFRCRNLSYQVSASRGFRRQRGDQLWGAAKLSVIKKNGDVVLNESYNQGTGIYQPKKSS